MYWNHAKHVLVALYVVFHALQGALSFATWPRNAILGVPPPCYPDSGVLVRYCSRISIDFWFSVRLGDHSPKIKHARYFDVFSTLYSTYFDLFVYCLLLCTILCTMCPVYVQVTHAWQKMAFASLARAIDARGRAKIGGQFSDIAKWTWQTVPSSLSRRMTSI